ncbi:hypothetical protein FLCU109888_06455 [Flavobacterium cucumis]|jgi:hypothetical protein|uniref:TM2 domain-containing protein n=1 Tax=Flavobacterium cucumis TaxID=416016 RepID=A0A1M7ZXA7_9FLAO|nr:hypothetical protein [Flavobacterium cucumis]SHO73524.1 hypothetical protein SAMN05443547_1885 [Flavobacterium cucumis]
MKYLLLILSLLNFSLSFSQEIVFKNRDFYQNEEKLTNSEIKEKLAEDITALAYYKTAKTKSTVGGLLLGFGLGFMLTDAIVGGNTYNYKFPGAPTFIGLGAIVISIPVLSGREKLLNKSVDTYNANIKSKLDNSDNALELNIVSNNSGFGIQLNF